MVAKGKVHPSPATLFVAAVALCGVLFAIAWLLREAPDDAPYLEFAGGGFVFNYRISEIFYGFTAVVVRPLPTGSIIEAGFEDPGGGPPLVVRQRVGTMTDRYMLRSPPVRGVKAGRPYNVAIRVLARDGEQELWRTQRSYSSQLDDTVIGSEPLTRGPGYAPWHRPE